MSTLATAQMPPPKEQKHVYGRTESPFLKLLTSGLVTICFEGLAGGHYLEMLKILKQTSNDTYWTITKRMTASKGIVGVLDGYVIFKFR